MGTLLYIRKGSFVAKADHEGRKSSVSLYSYSHMKNAKKDVVAVEHVSTNLCFGGWGAIHVLFDVHIRNIPCSHEA